MKLKELKEYCESKDTCDDWCEFAVKEGGEFVACDFGVPPTRWNLESIETAVKGGK